MCLSGKNRVLMLEISGIMTTGFSLGVLCSFPCLNFFALVYSRDGLPYQVDFSLNGLMDSSNTSMLH